jgi:hypothetical protein
MKECYRDHFEPWNYRIIWFGNNNEISLRVGLMTNAIILRMIHGS